MLPTTTTALFLLLLAQLCYHATPAPTTPNKLKVVVLNSKPFSFLDLENAPSDDQAEYSGVLIDLFKETADRLNISYEFYQVPDGKYGYKDENGRWRGLIGELLEGNADVAVAPLTITPQRSKVVRFGRSIVPAGIVPIIKRPAAGQPLPFATIDELAAETELLYGSVKDGATYQFFANAPNGSVYAFVGQQMNARSDEVMARSYEEGVKRVREGGYVFFGEQYSLELMASRAPCNLMLVGGNPITSWHYAFAFRKEAIDLTDQFDQALIEQEWDVHRAITKYWEPQCAKPEICMCGAPQVKNVHAKNAIEFDDKDEDKLEREKNDDDEDESKEEEERKEDKTGNEEKVTDKTELPQPENTEQVQPASSTVKSNSVIEQSAHEVISEEKNDDAESESSTAKAEEGNRQDDNTEPPAVAENNAENGEQGVENASDDLVVADGKNETDAEL